MVTNAAHVTLMYGTSALRPRNMASGQWNRRRFGEAKSTNGGRLDFLLDQGSKENSAELHWETYNKRLMSLSSYSSKVIGPWLSITAGIVV